MVCGIFVSSGGSVKCGHLTHVYAMFSRDGVCMRQMFHRCVPKCDLCDLYIFTELDMYDLQDLCDLQGLCDLQDFCMIWRICESWILHTCFSMLSLDGVCMR